MHALTPALDIFLSHGGVLTCLSGDCVSIHYISSAIQNALYSRTEPTEVRHPLKFVFNGRRQMIKQKSETFWRVTNAIKETEQHDMVVEWGCCLGCRGEGLEVEIYEPRLGLKEASTEHEWAQQVQRHWQV